MAMDTWLMQGGWGFLEASEIDPLLDKMEEAEIRHLAFGGPLPLAPEPRHYEGPLKGCPPPPATRARPAPLLDPEVWETAETHFDTATPLRALLPGDAEIVSTDANCAACGGGGAGAGRCCTTTTRPGSMGGGGLILISLE